MRIATLRPKLATLNATRVRHTPTIERPSARMRGYHLLHLRHGEFSSGDVQRPLKLGLQIAKLVEAALCVGRFISAEERQRLRFVWPANEVVLVEEHHEVVADQKVYTDRIENGSPHLSVRRYLAL
jgi:hypothetical protein